MTSSPRRCQRSARPRSQRNCCRQNSTDGRSRTRHCWVTRRLRIKPRGISVMTDEHKTSAPRAALITGAGRRIGRAITLALSRAGFAVVLHAHRSRAEAEKLAEEIVQAGGQAAVVLADFANGEALRKLVPAAATFGPLTLLVNNASQFEEDEIATLDRARFEQTIAVNLTAPLFLGKAFAAQAPEGSSIVNVLDQRVLKPTPRFFLLHTEQERAPHCDHHVGPGAVAEAASQCGGAWADAAEPASIGRAVRRAGRRRAVATRADSGRCGSGRSLSGRSEKRNRDGDRSGRRTTSGLARHR